MLYGPIVPRLLALGSWFPVLGPGQDGSISPGQVLCSEMGGAFVIRRGYKTARPVTSSFCLTVPSQMLFDQRGTFDQGA